MSAGDCTTCTHAKRDHIYEIGACRPGFVCPVGCRAYAAAPVGPRPDECDHGPAAQLLDQVHCLTCDHSHIATIPTTTFRCSHCGFGSWAVSVAEAHATTYPRHLVYPQHHQTVPIPAA